VAKAWNDGYRRFGISGRFDAHSHKFGINPKPSEELPHGQIADGEVRVEVSYGAKRIELIAGAGYGKMRGTISEPLRSYISPSLSFALVVGSLTQDSLIDENGVIRLVDGKLPPRLVVGLDASLRCALEKPEIQDQRVQKVTMTAFVDFRFTENLAVRLGAPVSAVMVVRPADSTTTPPVIEKRGLQWTVPVFFGTVAKL
jgi:hypothetical protein